MKEKLTGKLINAIEAGNLKKAKRLVFFGASVNGFLYSQVEPPVFTASRTGNAEILRYLKSKGANFVRIKILQAGKFPNEKIDRRYRQFYFT